MYCQKLLLLALLLGFYAETPAQVVDRIKTASDNFQDNSYPDNGTRESNSNVPRTPRQNSNTGFGGAVPAVTYPVRISNPEDRFQGGGLDSPQYLEEDELDDEGDLGSAEGSWTYSASQVRMLEEEERKQFLFEEARRGRFRRWHGHARLQGAFRSEYGIALPRVGVGYAGLSTELRVNHIVEAGVSFIAHYRTWDWQVINLRVLDLKHWSWSMGVGAIFEEYSGEVFEEYTSVIRLHFLEGRLSIPIEGRLGIQDGLITKAEASAIANWMFYGGNHSKISLSMGYLRQLYFLEVETSGAMLGLQVEFF